MRITGVETICLRYQMPYPLTYARGEFQTREFGRPVTAYASAGYYHREVWSFRASDPGSGSTSTRRHLNGGRSDRRRTGAHRCECRDLGGP